jgi:hypothetical protein
MRKNGNFHNLTPPKKVSIKVKNILRFIINILYIYK